MNALNTTINEVVEMVKKDHEREIAAKNAEISALKAKIGEARGLLRDIAAHLNRWGRGLDADNKPSKLVITERVEQFLASIQKVQP